MDLDQFIDKALRELAREAIRERSAETLRRLGATEAQIKEVLDSPRSQS